METLSVEEHKQILRNYESLVANQPTAELQIRLERTALDLYKHYQSKNQMPIAKEIQLAKHCVSLAVVMAGEVIDALPEFAELLDEIEPPTRNKPNQAHDFI